MSRVFYILLVIAVVAVFGILVAMSWNGWLADQGNSNRIIAMASDLQRWLVQMVGPKPTAGIFGCIALFFLWAGITSFPRGKAD